MLQILAVSLKLRLRLVALAMVTILTSPLAGATGALAADKLIVTEGAHVIGYLPIYIAINEGLFAKEGLDVEIVPTRGSTQAVAALIGGSADVALATVSDAANAAARGRHLKLIAAITSQPQMMLTVSDEFAKKHNVTASSPLDQKLNALKGGKYAVSAPGSMTDDVMRTLLQMAKLSPDRDVQILALGGNGSEMVGALTRGSIDGFVLSPPAGNQILATGKGIILINLMNGDIPKYRDMMFQAVISTPDKISAKHDKLVRFVRAIGQAQSLMQGDAAKALALGEKAFPNVDPKVLKSAFESAAGSFSKTPLVPVAGVEKALEFVPHKGNLTANALIDNSIAKAAQ